MKEKEKKLIQKKLDALYINHNPVDTFVIYFCVCFAIIRIIHDLIFQSAPVHVYIVSLVFSICTGYIMTIWAKQTFIRLKLRNIL